MRIGRSSRRPQPPRTIGARHARGERRRPSRVSTSKLPTSSRVSATLTRTTPGNRLQRALHVVGRPLRLHEHRDGAVQPFGQRFRRVGRDDLALVDDHDLLAGLRDFRKDVRAQHDRVIAGELANQLPRSR